MKGSCHDVRRPRAATHAALSPVRGADLCRMQSDGAVARGIVRESFSRTPHPVLSRRAGRGRRTARLDTQAGPARRSTARFASRPCAAIHGLVRSRPCDPRLDSQPALRGAAGPARRSHQKPLSPSASSMGRGVGVRGRVHNRMRSGPVIAVPSTSSGTQLTAAPHRPRTTPSPVFLLPPSVARLTANTPSSSSARAPDRASPGACAAR